MNDVLIEFFVPALPIAKPRMTQRDKFNPSRSVQQFRGWADMVRWAGRRAMRGRPLFQSALVLECVFALPMPKRWSRSSQRMAKEGQIFHVTKPDLKNLVAGVEDALNGIVWIDDSQIVQHNTSKHYAGVPARGKGESLVGCGIIVSPAIAPYEVDDFPFERPFKMPERVQ